MPTSCIVVGILSLSRVVHDAFRPLRHCQVNKKRLIYLNITSNMTFQYQFLRTGRYVSRAIGPDSEEMNSENYIVQDEG